MVKVATSGYKRNVPEGKAKRQGKKVKRLRVQKREVIRVESEETQHNVREAMDLSQEEAEEISFVPSAISVPQKPLFRCDNRCSENPLSFWQFSSVVIKRVRNHTRPTYASNVTTSLWWQEGIND